MTVHFGASKSVQALGHCCPRDILRHYTALSIGEFRTWKSIRNFNWHGAMKWSCGQKMACIWQPVIVNDTTK
jgi:hypothetical protein